MKINYIILFFSWLWGMMISYNNIQGVLAVTSMTFILVFILFFDDSRKLNPTHIEYDGKKFPTLTQLIDYVKKNATKTK